MPKIGKFVRYNSDGNDVLAQIVGISKDAKSQVDGERCACGASHLKKEVPTHLDDKGQPLTDGNVLELAELEVRHLGTDALGRDLGDERRIVRGRAGVPKAKSLTAFKSTPNTWWPDAGEES